MTLVAHLSATTLAESDLATLLGRRLPALEDGHVSGLGEEETGRHRWLYWREWGLPADIGVASVRCWQSEFFRN